MSDYIESTTDGELPDLSRLLAQQVPQDLAFDDDPIEAIIYGTAPKAPTPADVCQMWQAGIRESDEFTKALARVLVAHPEELLKFQESLSQNQFESLLDVLLRVNRAQGPDTEAFLKNLIACLEQLGRLDEARQLREEQFQQRLAASPEDDKVWNEYAIFLKNERNNYGGAERAYRRALELAPKNATTLANLALLLTSVFERHDEAEFLYEEALALGPENATTFSNAAFFHENIRRNLDRAEQLYQQAVKLDPNDQWIQGNYATLLLIRNQTDEARRLVTQAWRQLEKRQARVSTRLLYVRAALDCLEGRDIRLYLGQLKTLFGWGISHAPWTITAVRDFLRGKLCLSDFEFFQALSDAIDDRNAVERLGQFELWQTSERIPLDTPWPQL